MNEIRRDIIAIVLIFLVSFPAVRSLLQPGFFQTHDGDWHVAHVYWFDKAIKQGHFPVRWVDEINRGRGYPFFNFYYPLLYYLAEIPYLGGLGLVNSLKLVLILSFPLSGVAMYAWVKQLWGRLAGFVAAVLLIYAPYRFVAVYVAARFGETVALVWIPATLAAITAWVRTKQIRWLGLAAGFWAGVILSHNIQALVFSPFIVAYMIVMKRGKYILAVVTLALGAAAYFWLPAMIEKTWTLQGYQVAYNFATNFPSLKAYLYQPWGYGLNTTGQVGGVSMQIGLAQLMALGMSLLWIRKKVKLPRFLWIWAAMTFFLMNKISLPVWETVPLLPQIQIPSRLLGMMILLASALGGWVGRNNRFLAVLLIILALYANRNYLRPGYFERYFDQDYLNNVEFLYGTTDPYGENMPVWTRYSIYTFFNDKVLSDSRSPEIVKIDNVENRPRYYSFTAEVERYGWVVIKAMYYPGWQVRLDGKPYRFQFEQAYGQEEWGHLVIGVPKGKHQVEVRFAETGFRKAANAGSIISWILIAGMCLPNIMYKKRG